MIQTLKPNSVGNDYIVGDLHGCYDLLVTALDNLDFNPTKDRLISVGDLIDHGQKNEECLNLLEEDWFYSVRGNHEDLMLAHFSGNPMGVYWDYNGGGWWRSCSFKDDEIKVKRLIELVVALPFCIILELPDNKKCYVIHAELPVNELTDENFKEEFSKAAFTQMGDGEAVLWGRDKFGMFYAQDLSRLAKAKRTVAYHGFNKKSNLSHIYSGHTIVRQPLTISGQTCIDTGAFRTEKSSWAGLTLVNPSTQEFWTTNYEGTRKVQPIEL